MEYCSTKCGYLSMVCIMSQSGDLMYSMVLWCTNMFIVQCCVFKAPHSLCIHRADGDWDRDDRRIYLNSTFSFLYFSDYPYNAGQQLFDNNLGQHNMFSIVGRYIFAQKTENDVVGLYVSDRRGPFSKAHIPIPGGHQRYSYNIFCRLSVCILS